MNIRVAALALATVAGSAFAGEVFPGPQTINLGGGWQVTVANALTTQITSVNGQTALQDGYLAITKTASFTQVDPFTDAPQPISITFTQIADDANTASVIRINQEFLTNLTGLTWGGFRQQLALSGAATFDNASTGMSVGPNFTTNTMSAGNREMITSGGPGVASGSSWNPGATGDLIININLGASGTPVVFTLKEIPLVPTPGAKPEYARSIFVRRLEHILLLDERR